MLRVSVICALTCRTCMLRFGAHAHKTVLHTVQRPMSTHTLACVLQAAQLLPSTD